MSRWAPLWVLGANCCFTELLCESHQKAGARYLLVAGAATPQMKVSSASSPQAPRWGCDTWQAVVSLQQPPSWVATAAVLEVRGDGAALCSHQLLPPAPQPNPTPANECQHGAALKLSCHLQPFLKHLTDPGFTGKEVTQAETLFPSWRPLFWSRQQWRSSTPASGHGEIRAEKHCPPSASSSPQLHRSLPTAQGEAREGEFLFPHILNCCYFTYLPLRWAVCSEMTLSAFRQSATTGNSFPPTVTQLEAWQQLYA